MPEDYDYDDCLRHAPDMADIQRRVRDAMNAPSSLPESYPSNDPCAQQRSQRQPCRCCGCRSRQPQCANQRQSSQSSLPQRSHTPTNLPTREQRRVTLPTATERSHSRTTSTSLPTRERKSVTLPTATERSQSSGLPTRQPKSIGDDIAQETGKRTAKTVDLPSRQSHDPFKLKSPESGNTSTMVLPTREAVSTKDLLSQATNRAAKDLNLPKHAPKQLDLPSARSSRQTAVLPTRTPQTIGELETRKAVEPALSSRTPASVSLPAHESTGSIQLKEWEQQTSLSLPTQTANKVALKDWESKHPELTSHAAKNIAVATAKTSQVVDELTTQPEVVDELTSELRKAIEKMQLSNARTAPVTDSVAVTVPSRLQRNSEVQEKVKNQKLVYA